MRFILISSTTASPEMSGAAANVMAPALQRGHGEATAEGSWKERVMRLTARGKRNDAIRQLRSSRRAPEAVA